MSKLQFDFDNEKNKMIKNEYQNGMGIYNSCQQLYDKGSSINFIYDGLNDSCKCSLKREAKKRTANVYDTLEYYLKRHDDFTLSGFFAKNPIRTNSAEKYQYEVINTQSQYKGLINLASKPKRRIMLMNADKSVDFMFDGVKAKSGKTFRVFINAKYTHEEGGIQDSQLNELESFAKASDYYYTQNKNNCKQKDTVNDDGSILINDGSDVIIVLLADGDYFKKPRKKYGNMNYYQHIANTHASYNHNLIVTTTEDFDDNLSALLSTL